MTAEKIRRLKEQLEIGDPLKDVCDIHELAVYIFELIEQNAQQLAACDCAAMMDTAKTHEENKTVQRDSHFWSPAFESVMRRTAECIKLRADLAAQIAENTRLKDAFRIQRKNYIDLHEEIIGDGTIVGMPDARETVREIKAEIIRLKNWNAERAGQFAVTEQRLASDLAKCRTALDGFFTEGSSLAATHPHLAGYMTFPQKVWAAAQIARKPIEPLVK